MTTPISVDFDIEAEAMANPRDLPRARRLAMLLRRTSTIFTTALMENAAMLCYEAAALIDALDAEVRSLSSDLLSTDSPSEP